MPWRAIGQVNRRRQRAWASHTAAHPQHHVAFIRDDLVSEPPIIEEHVTSGRIALTPQPPQAPTSWPDSQADPRDMDRLSIGFLGGFGLPPVEFVNLTADLGCRCMSAVVQGLPLVPLDYPPYSLKDDVALRGELLAAMNHRGVTISLGDGFLVLPDADIHMYATDLDVLAELGVPRINVVSLDPDLGRTFDQFATLTDLAAQRGLQTVVEPVPGLTVGDLATGLAAAEHVGRSDFRLLIDTMHLVRSGSSAADVGAIDPDRIGYAQLNDTTLRPRLDNYMEEAMFERMVPGEGELPLRDILSALPPDIVIELEVPRRSLALAGVSPIDRLRPCVEAARRLLSEVERRQ